MVITTNFVVPSLVKTIINIIHIQMKVKLLLLTLLVSVFSWGQTFNATYAFGSVTTTSGTTDPTPVPTATGAVFGSFNAVGVTGNSTANTRFSLTGWDTGATTGSDVFTGVINTGKYYQVTITPALGYTLDINSIVFTLQRSGTGIRQYSVRSSLDYTTNLPASISPANTALSVVATNIFEVTDNNTAQNGSTVTLGSSYDAISSAVTFRFYGWNAEAAGGSFSIDNVVINGVATAVSSCTAPTINPTVSATQNVFSDIDFTGSVTDVGGGTTVTTRGFQISTSNTMTTPTDLSEASTATGSYTLNTTLNGNTRYYYRAYAINDCATPQTGYSSATPVTTSIVTKQFSTTANAATNISSSSFTANWTNPGGGTETYTYKLYVLVDDGVGGFTPFANYTSISSATPFYNVTGLTPNTLYRYYFLSNNSAGDSVLPSNSIDVTTLSPGSDVIENSSYSYSSNIDYTLYQVPTISNTSQSVGVFQFIIRDGGLSASTDTKNTELNAISFNVTNLSNIRTAALFFGNTLINATPSIGASTISFSGLSGTNVTALDGSTKTITLRVTFNTIVTDNQQLEFAIASATANATGTIFDATNAGGATSSTTTDRNRIEVTADRLAFVVQPVNAAQNAAMATAPNIKACDVNSNTDLDYSTAISITSTGTMTGSPISVVPTIGTGVSIFSGIVHTSNGTYTLGATSGTLAGMTSSSFVITAFSFAAGDFRPLYPTDLSFNGDWEYFNGTSWVAVPDNNAPQNTAVTINRILIDKYVTGGGSNAKAYNCDFIIQAGGELLIVANDVPPVAAQMIAAGKKIEVLSGGILTIEGDIDVTTTSNLIVREGGEMYLNQNSIDNTHPMWDGVELFESGSYVVIWDWNWSASPTNRSIVNINDTNISNNANGYKFGNLYLDITPTDNFTIVGGPVGIINIAENDFDITNNTAFYVLGSTNSTGTNGYLVNGNLIVNDGPFSFGASFSNSAFNHQFTINGDFQCLSNDILKIHHSSSGTPTSLSGNVTFKGNVKVASTVTSFLNDGGTGTPSRMTVNFDGGTLISPKLIDIAPTAVAMPMAIKGTSVRAFATQDLTTNSIAGYTAPFTVETGGTLHFGWAADGTTPLVLKKTTTSPAGTNTFISQTGTTLISTSLDGLQKASGTTGNVQYASSNKTFDQTAVFWYVGKNDQVTGDVFTTGGTAKTIICDLIDNTKKLTLSSSTSITAPGLLNIIKGQFFESTTALITGSTGGLTMEDGTRYVIPSLSSSATDFIPRMDGLSSIYNLSGNSTIELNGADGASVYDQYLRGSRNYRNLTFSTSGTKTISSAITSITGTITVADAAVLNVDDKGMGGIGTNLTMTGTSQYITAGIGVKPDASETYNLGTGTKVTFTSGSIAVPILTLQQIRLAPNYYNIDVLGNNVGTNTATGPVKIQSGGTFTVKSNGVFKHSNTAGFSGSNVTAIDNTNTPTITLEANSTIDYAGADQTITLFSPSYRNLTISGTGVKTLQNDTATRVEEDLKVDAARLLLTINQILTVREGVSIAATGAEFELNNNAQLIQIDEVDTNVGTNFKLKRLAFVHAQDYVYWSSPVFGFDVGLIPTQQRYFWNPIFANTNGTVGNWNSATGADAIMSVGKGYIVNCGSGFPNRPLPTGDLETNFVGRPNNGTLTSTIQRGSNALSIDDNWNLVGNPYPSAIFAEEFLDANVTKINGSVWVWTHGQAPDNAIDPYYDNFGANYYATDYLKYNKLGATDTTFNGIIASGQGFMVNMLHATPSTTETVTFTNAMRTDATATPYNNAGFYRTANTNLTVANPEEKHRIWLSIINTAVGQKESALLGYSANSTLAADHFYDCIYVPRTEVGIYTLVNTGEYVIQGRPLPFLDSDLVPMGVKIVNAGSHKIAIKKVDGLFEGNQGIYLEDTVLGIVHDLKAAPYTFTSEVGVFNSRFIVRYTPSALSNDDFDSLDNNVVVSTQSTDVSIKSANELMSSVIVYDILGRELVRKNNINANDITLPNVSAVNQALIVKITLENGQVVTRKITL